MMIICHGPLREEHVLQYIITTGGRGFWVLHESEEHHWAARLTRAQQAMSSWPRLNTLTRCVVLQTGMLTGMF